MINTSIEHNTQTVLLKSEQRTVMINTPIEHTKRSY